MLLCDSVKSQNYWFGLRLKLCVLHVGGGVQCPEVGLILADLVRILFLFKDYENKIPFS